MLMHLKLFIDGKIRFFFHFFNKIKHFYSYFLIGKPHKCSLAIALARLSPKVCSSTNVLTHSMELFSHLISLADEMEN